MRKFWRIAAAVVAAATLPCLAQNAERGWPRVCKNADLLKAIRVMEKACGETCDTQALREVEQVDRAALLASLRDPNVTPVHIFFPLGESSVSRALDWERVKRDQLASIKYIPDPTNAIVFVVGHASLSGDSDYNLLLSRARMNSVLSYLRDVLQVRSRQFRGIWVGEEILNLTESDAAFLNIPKGDYRDDEMVLNQSVHVFVYPCAELLRNGH